MFLLEPLNAEATPVSEIIEIRSNFLNFYYYQNKMKYSLAVLALVGMCMESANSLRIKQALANEKGEIETTTTETKAVNDPGATPSTLNEETSAIADAASSSVSSSGSSPCS